MRCALCEAPCIAEPVATITLDRCSACHALWFDRTELAAALNARVPGIAVDWGRLLRPGKECSLRPSEGCRNASNESVFWMECTHPGDTRGRAPLGAAAQPAGVPDPVSPTYRSAIGLGLPIGHRIRHQGAVTWLHHHGRSQVNTTKPAAVISSAPAFRGSWQSCRPKGPAR